MIARYPTIDGIKCLDPGALYSNRSAAPQDFWGLANSITCPTGQSPGSAYLVIPRIVNDSLSMNDLHDIEWTQEVYNDVGQRISQTVTTWQNYVICRQWMVGVDGDGKSAALAELRDKRHLMLGAANIEYNVRKHSGGTYSSGSPADQFYTDTISGGTTPHTWQHLLDDLWLYLPSAIRGTTPTLPYVPVQKPEDFKAHGDAWEAIGRLLAMCQSRLVLDPIADAFSVVRVGALQSGLASQVAQLATRVAWDATPRQNLQLATIPETFRFYFPKYGIPNQTDAGGQTVRPYYTIEKPSNLTGCQAGTVKPYFMSQQAIFSSQTEADKATGLAVPQNDSELQNLATETAEKLGNKLDLGSERGRIIYNGIVSTTSLSLGSEVGSICWRDYGATGPGAEGCVTDARTAEELPDGDAGPIDRVPQNNPRYGYHAAGSASDLGSNLLQMTNWAADWNIGSLFSISGTSLTVIATLGATEQKFLIEWVVVATGEGLIIPSATNSKARATLNGLDLGTTTFNVDPTSVQNFTHSHYNFAQSYLKTGDVLKLEAEFISGNSQGRSATGHIRVTPLQFF